MKRAKRNYIIYTVMLIVFALAMVWVAQVGKNYDGMAPQPGAGVTQSMGEMIYGTLTGNLNHPLSLLLLQIIAIMIAVRIFSYLFKYLGQPGVIGEIVAGIVLGPSVLGHFFPETFSFLFAPESLVPLNVISQIGLVLFMFVIGMELDLGVVRRKASETLVISHASIIVPFFMGMIWPMSSIPSSGPDTPHLCRSRCLSPFRSVLPPSLFWPVSCRNGIWERRRWVCWPSPVRPTTT